MIKGPNLPLRFVLSLGAALFIGTILLVTGPLISSQTRAFLLGEAEENAASHSIFFTHVMEAFRGDINSMQNRSKIRRIVENIGVSPGISAVYLVSRDGTVLISSGDVDVDEGTPAPTALKAAIDQALQPEPYLKDQGRFSYGNRLGIVRPVSGGVYRPGLHGDVLAFTVLIFDLSQHERQASNQLRFITFVLIGSTTLLGLLMYALISWRVVRPLNAIASAIRIIGHSNPDHRVPVSFNDELGAVASALNETLDRLREVTVSKNELEVLHGELLQAQTRLIESSKMASLGEMAAGIAHEINNPLAIINSRTAQLRRLVAKVQPGAPESVEAIMTCATKIEQTVSRIAKIVRSLRWFARDTHEDPFEEAPLTGIVSETLELCQERFKNHQVELRIQEIPNDLMLHCRPVQIAQVLLNLLNNALDAVEKSEARWVEMKVAMEGGFIVISVSDSGPGVPLELRSKIMQPFFTTKEIGKGTGLGLSLSQGIIASHKGQLSLDASSDVTCFRIRLPWRAPGAYSTPA